MKTVSAGTGTVVPPGSPLQIQKIIDPFIRQLLDIID